MDFFEEKKITSVAAVFGLAPLEMRKTTEKIAHLTIVQSFFCFC